jgi:hypothetical protein
MRTRAPVILKLEGGLGNQLFQLAAGYFSAAKLETDLYLDQYSIPFTTVHGESANGFDPFEPIVLPNSRRVHLLPDLPSKFMTFFARRNLLVKMLLMKFRLYRSNPDRLELFLEANELKSSTEFLRIEKAMKLHGNFQSWEIVEKASEYGFPRILRLKDIPKWVLELEQTIDFKNSIVLHFRVGDDTRTNHNFRQPEIRYYLEAIGVLNSKRRFSRIFVLSDDIPRVREMFGAQLGDDFDYLEMPSESLPAERLYVLSLFGGIVCANSTFCGWAAWTIYNSGGEVVVPVPYSDGPILGSRDFPPQWHRLDKISGKIVS